MGKCVCDKVRVNSSARADLRAPYVLSLSSCLFLWSLNLTWGQASLTPPHHQNSLSFISHEGTLSSTFSFFFFYPDPFLYILRDLSKDSQATVLGLYFCPFILHILIFPSECEQMCIDVFGVCLCVFASCACKRVLQSIYIYWWFMSDRSHSFISGGIFFPRGRIHSLYRCLVLVRALACMNACPSFSINNRSN